MVSVLQSVNGTQFSNTTCEAAAKGWFFCTRLSLAAAIVLVTVIFLVTKVYASE